MGNCNHLETSPGDNASLVDAIKPCKKDSSACNVVSIWKHPSCQMDPKGRNEAYRYCTFYNYAETQDLDAKGAFYTIERGANPPSPKKFQMRFAYKFELCTPTDALDADCDCHKPSQLD